MVNRGTPKALTDEQVAEIVRLYDRSRGTSANALAKQFRVSRPTIDKALKRAGVKN
ncbi:helix-turn-helix domain-containing protein [Klebsiella pneumoniae]|uniref:helix-turn-helix domain-containing protein n=1 Tax=Klebsiella pneumoniae TaxID=573 RepID=UPI0034D37A8F